MDHAPEAVGFAAFEELEGRGTVEGRIGRAEPRTDSRRLDQIGQGGEEPMNFGEFAHAGATGHFSGGPCGDGAGRKTGKSGKIIAFHPVRQC